MGSDAAPVIWIGRVVPANTSRSPRRTGGDSAGAAPTPSAQQPTANRACTRSPGRFALHSLARSARGLVAPAGMLEQQVGDGDRSVAAGRRARRAGGQLE